MATYDFEDGLIPPSEFGVPANFEIVGGNLKLVADEAAFTAIHFAGGAANGNVTASINLSGRSSGAYGIIVRGASDGSGLFIAFTPTSSTSSKGKFYTVSSSGSFSTIFTGDFITNYDPNGFNTIEVELSGDTVTATFCGTTTETIITTHNQTESQIGFSATKADTLLGNISTEAIAGVFNIVWDGDSRTIGAGSTPATPIPERAAAALSPTPVYSNFGVSGQETSDARATFNTNVAAAYNANAQDNIYVINGFGINDIRLGRSSADIIADLTWLADSAKALGYKVLISTIPPRDTTPAQGEAYRQEVNAWIMTNTLPSIDSAVDLNADERIGVWSSDYYSDISHLTFEGQEIWTRIIVNQIVANSNLVSTLPEVSNLNLSIGAPDGTYKVYLLDQSDNVAYNGNVSFSGGATTIYDLTQAAGTALEGYTIDNESPHVNGAVITGVTA